MMGLSRRVSLIEICFYTLWIKEGRELLNSRLICSYEKDIRVKFFIGILSRIQI